MAIVKFTPEQLADVIGKGMMRGFEDALRVHLTKCANAVVDLAVEELVKGVKAYVRCVDDVRYDRTEITLYIDGVRQSKEKGLTA